MRTHVNLDENLLDQVVQLGHFSTKKSRYPSRSDRIRENAQTPAIIVTAWSGAMAG
jgi:metal-responsive CopG/Arc/MetJ family transcriptional regulator